MLPFSLKVNGYKGIQTVLKGVGKFLPFPKPTLFSGPDSSLELCQAIGQMGTIKLLIVTDAMLVKLGLLKKIQKALKDYGVDHIVFDGVLPDPNFDQVEAGLKVYQNSGCDAILAVGGGSPIDCAKVIAARATNDKSIQKLAGMFRVFNTPAPLYAVPTTAGTGSEVTIAAVVSDPVTHAKNNVLDPKIVPIMASLDGALMTGIPPMITAATGMDALTHAIEAYISSNAVPETDSYALAATKLIMDNLVTAFKDGKNIDARQNMAQASFYAGLAFTRAGVGYVHAIAHNFGAKYHTPHGLANSIVLPHILDYSKPVVIDRLAKLAEASGLKKGNPSNDKLAQLFIDKVRSLLKTFGIAETLDALKADDIPAITKSALKEAHYTYAVPRYMDPETCEALITKMIA